MRVSFFIRAREIYTRWTEMFVCWSEWEGRASAEEQRESESNRGIEWLALIIHPYFNHMSFALKENMFRICSTVCLGMCPHFTSAVIQQNKMAQIQLLIHFSERMKEIERGSKRKRVASERKKWIACVIVFNSFSLFSHAFRIVIRRARTKKFSDAVVACSFSTS